MPNGLDCSGFVTWSLYNSGLDVGDIGAGINDKYKEQYGIKSQLLHAHRVVFEDGMEIKDEIPDVFKKLM